MGNVRKTIAVAKVLEKINFALAYRDRKLAADLTPEQAYRRGIASVMEMILFETGTYKGFGFLDVDYDTDPPTIPDESRRVYYRHPGLK